MDSKAAEYIRGADLIIFDEATMADRFVFETIDTLLREIMDYEAPFGGKVMLIGTAYVIYYLSMSALFRRRLEAAPPSRDRQDSRCRCVVHSHVQ